MAKARTDIFPNLPDCDRETAVDRYWIAEAFEAIGHLFENNKDKFIDFLNDIKSTSDAETFIRLCQFYLIAKKQETSPSTKLIMLISIIEKLSNRDNKFMPFEHWITRKEQIEEVVKYLGESGPVGVKEFKKVVERLKEKYYIVFGSQRNVFSFFQNIPLKDKILIIKSFKTVRAKVIEGFVGIYNKEVLEKFTTIDEFAQAHDYTLEEEFTPQCYNWKCCYLDYGQCLEDYGCWLKENEKEVNEYLKKTINLIYQMRSDFVHNATMRVLNEEGVLFLCDYINENFVSIELTIESFQDIFERTFKDYFEDLKRTKTVR